MVWKCLHYFFFPCSICYDIREHLRLFFSSSVSDDWTKGFHYTSFLVSYCYPSYVRFPFGKRQRQAGSIYGVGICGWLVFIPYFLTSFFFFFFFFFPFILFPFHLTKLEFLDSFVTFFPFYLFYTHVFFFIP